MDKIEIEANGYLEDLQWLPTGAQIEEVLVKDNSHISLDALANIGEDFEIRDNSSLTTLECLAPETRIGNGLYIENNAPGCNSLEQIRDQGSCAVSSEPEVGLPGAYALDQNYPNPLARRTTITFEVPRPGPVTIGVYDVLGRGMVVLVSDTYIPGRYEVEWDAEEYPGGVYFYRLEAGDVSLTRKLLLY